MNLNPTRVAVFGHHKLTPLRLTLDELRAVLLPICAGYKWAEDTIPDLWYLGSPQPMRWTGKRMDEVRLILPAQLASWLQDVLEKTGRPLDTAAKLYNQGLRIDHGR